MKILVIDDTTTERVAGVVAVKAAGHEAIVPRSQQPVEIPTEGDFIDYFDAVYKHPLRDELMTDRLQMTYSMDKPSIEKMREALQWGNDKLEEVEMSIILKLLVEVDGVITDLHFWPRAEMAKRFATTKPPQSGLLVALASQAMGKSVVICTDAGRGDDHHSVTYGWIHDAFVKEWRSKDMAGQSLPFGWVENKDWPNAVRQLEQRSQGK